MKDPKKVRARREVSRRFRAFFAALQQDLTDGAEEVWQRVERRLQHGEGLRTAGGDPGARPQRT